MPASDSCRALAPTDLGCRASAALHLGAECLVLSAIMHALVDRTQLIEYIANGNAGCSICLTYELVLQLHHESLCGADYETKPCRSSCAHRDWHMCVSQPTCGMCWQDQEKMSKSDPSSAIFMEDTEAEVNKKIKQAYCPPGIVKDNPCIAYLRLLVFPWLGKFEVKRPDNNGGDK